MLIQEISLENIKSYHKAVIRFNRGATAISGHNGAGKYTIIEAIGYALFDFLPYTRTGFLREGEKSGSVSVEIISGLDERRYQITRKITATGAGAWTVYDPELNYMTATGKDDTLNFLNEHMQMHSPVSLDKLFQSAVAVPQGTFTADFLQTGSVRKKKFDELLQVESYRTVFTNLIESVRNFEHRLHDKQVEIAGLQSQTEQLAELRIQRETIRRQREHTRDELFVWKEKLELTQAKLAIIQRQEDVVREINAEFAAQRSALQVLLERQTYAQDRWQAAQRDKEICERTKADYTRYNETEQKLQHVRNMQREAMTLKTLAQSCAADLKNIANQIADMEAAISQAEQAMQECVLLAPQAARFKELTQKKQIAQNAEENYKREQELLKQRNDECGAAQKKLSETETEIAEILRLQPIAEQFPVMNEQKTLLQTQKNEIIAVVSVHKERQKRINKLQNNEADLQKQLQKISADIADLQIKLPEAAQLHEQEQKTNEIMRAVAALEAEYNQTEQAMLEAKDGLCPFLKERCLNIAQKQYANLDDYLGELAAKRADELNTMRQTQEKETQRLKAIRLLAAETVNIPKLEKEFTETQKKLTETARELAEEQTAAQIEAARIAELPTTQRQLEDTEKSLQASESAWARYNQLELLKKNARQTKDDLQKTETALADIQKRIALLQPLKDEVPHILAELRALGNPEQKLAQAQVIAGNRDASAAKLADLQTQKQDIQQKLDGVTEQLTPYSDLDETALQFEQILSAAKDAHKAYVQAENGAAQAEALRQTAEKRQQEYIEAAQVLATLQNRIDMEIKKLQDLNAAEIREEFEQIQTAISEHNENERIYTRDLQKIEQEIQNKAELLSRLELLQNTAQSLTQVKESFEFCREKIRNSGQYVMAALLKKISDTANIIFCDIMGSRQITLTWNEDYEIMLRSGANSRTFAQLSGGEQMSAALAVRLAILRTLTRSSLAIFDEPTQNMDTERRQNLAGQIRRIRDFEQIIVISHDDTFEDGLDSIVRLEKRDSVTYIAAEGLKAFA